MMTRRFLPTTRWFEENKKKCSVLFRRTRPVIKARPTQTDRGERGVIVWTIGVANREHICTLFFFYTRFDMHEMQRHCWARPSNDGSKAAEMYTRNNRAVIIDREEKKKKVFPFSFLFFFVLGMRRKRRRGREIQCNKRCRWFLRRPFSSSSAGCEILTRPERWSTRE